MADDEARQQQEAVSAPDWGMILRILFARVVALEFLVKRLLVSDAQRFPDGVAGRMLSDIHPVLQDLANSMEPGYPQDLIEDYLRRHLWDARQQLEEVRSDLRSD